MHLAMLVIGTTILFVGFYVTATYVFAANRNRDAWYKYGKPVFGGLVLAMIGGSIVDTHWLPAFDTAVSFTSVWSAIVAVAGSATELAIGMLATWWNVVRAVTQDVAPLTGIMATIVGTLTFMSVAGIFVGYLKKEKADKEMPPTIKSKSHLAVVAGKAASAARARKQA